MKWPYIMSQNVESCVSTQRRDIPPKIFWSLSASHWQRYVDFAVGLPGVSMGFVLHPVSLPGIGVSTNA